MKGKINYTKEEKLNAISHAFGILFAIVGFYMLFSKNTSKTPYAFFGIMAYSLTLFLMFLVSTLYHSSLTINRKSRFRILDHVSIYWLIAGTYTPVALITLEHANGWPIFYTVCSLAVLGTIFKLFYTGKYEFISLLVYIAMGWLIVFDFENLIANTSDLAIRLLFLGGAFYTFGILFYAWEKILYNHFIWHLFVLGGAVSHWFMIYLYVV